MATIATVHRRLIPITAEKFRQYGDVLLTNGPLVFPEVDDGRLSVGITSFESHDNPYAHTYHENGRVRFEILASHFSYTQLMVVLSGVAALVVAPPSTRPERGDI